MPICNDVVEISVEETVETVTIEVDCVTETVLVQIEETTDVVQIEIADVGLRGPEGPAGSIVGWEQLSAIDQNIQLTGGVRTQLDLSVLVPAIKNLPEPYASHDFVLNGKFQPYGVLPGGKYRLRLNVEIIPDFIDHDVRFELTIGDDAVRVDSDTDRSTGDAGIQYTATPAFDFYTFTTFIATGGAVYITPNTDCTVHRITALITVEMIS